MAKLYETITAENWWGGKNGRKARHDQHCLYVYLYRHHEKYRRCADAIAALYPERTLGGLGVIRFNDHPDTTIDDVLRVLKFADV